MAHRPQYQMQTYRQRSQLPRLYTVWLMTPCVWRILCIRNSSSVPYFRQPPNLPIAARRNRKCAECVTTAFGRNRMSAESAHLARHFSTKIYVRKINKMPALTYLPEKNFSRFLLGGGVISPLPPSPTRMVKLRTVRYKVICIGILPRKSHQHPFSTF